jgi:hypothetical protein
MKRNNVLITIVALICILGTAIAVNAEPYKGRSVPSDEILQKNFEGGKWTLLGKRKGSDDTYTLYFYDKIKDKDHCITTKLVQLENGTWLILSKSILKVSIVEK